MHGSGGGKSVFEINVDSRHPVMRVVRCYKGNAVPHFVCHPGNDGEVDLCSHVIFADSSDADSVKNFLLSRGFSVKAITNLELSFVHKPKMALAQSEVELAIHARQKQT